MVTKETPIWQLNVGQFEALLNGLIPQPSEESANKYLSVSEAAGFIGKTPNALRVMVCKGQIKHIKKGGKLYFTQNDLIDYLESGRVNNDMVEPLDALVVKKKKGASTKMKTPFNIPAGGRGRNKNRKIKTKKQINIPLLTSELVIDLTPYSLHKCVLEIKQNEITILSGLADAIYLTNPELLVANVQRSLSEFFKDDKGGV